ncbi:MAG TPA: VOC family protein [Mobilitalea sp.]|nr:VOC family protein [Mobilitalea sp.]
MEFMIQLYVKKAKEAIELYTKAFDAELEYIDYTPKNTVLHSELKAHGQKLAIADSHGTAVTGTVFQIDVRMKKEEDVKRAYEILQEDSQTNVVLGPTFWSPCMVDFVDKFGVRWCLFAE